jgi:hypothetical protein
MELEIWKTLAIDNNCQVSSFGNFKRNGIIKVPYINGNGYRNVKIKKSTYDLHKLIALEFIPNPDSKPVIDHIDRNPLNNSINNLRWASIQENSRNRIFKKKNTPRGVYKHNAKFRAAIRINKKIKYLGSYDTPEKASEVYESYAKKEYGEFYACVL